MGFLENRADRVAKRRDWSDEQKAAWYEDKQEREGLNKFKRIVRGAASIGLNAVPFGLGEGVAKIIEATPLKNMPIVKEVVEENIAMIKQDHDSQIPKWAIAAGAILPAVRLFTQGKWSEGLASLAAFLVTAGYFGPKILELLP